MATTTREAPVQSTDECFDFLYAELRRIAQRMMLAERSDHTLSATALVNEAYVRLSESASSADDWDTRGHFITAAAETMRRVLIDRARARSTTKRAATRAHANLDEMSDRTPRDLDWIIDLNEGLIELETWDSQAAAMVKLRLFGGLNTIEAGRLLNMSRWTSYETWDFACAWFAKK